MSRSVLWFMMVNGWLHEKIILPNFEMTEDSLFSGPLFRNGDILELFDGRKLKKR